MVSISLGMASNVVARFVVLAESLTGALTKAGERVVEVNRPNRLARRMDG